MLSLLLACAPPALEDPQFNPAELPEQAELLSLGSARAQVDGTAFPMDDPELDWGRRGVEVLDWDSDSVQVAISSGGVLWAFWVDRDDLTSTVVADVWVSVGDQSAGVDLPAGLRIQAAPSPHGWTLEHPEGLLPIHAPADVVDQVYADTGLKDRVYGGRGAYFRLLPGAQLLDGVDGAPFAENTQDSAVWIEPLEREGAGQWVRWSAPFGDAEGWVADQDLEDMGNSAGGWGVGCCMCGGLGSLGYGLFGEPTLPHDTLLLDAPDGVVIGRVEWDMQVPLGEPAWGRTPVTLKAPWGPVEVWAQL
ncbi:MAG: hypothetical protein VX899_23805 [Myxococcota bacterium]|nr:hypothetical protein [Myxococcota bacterium]